MSRFISFVLLLLVIAVSVGFFRGWFSLTTDKVPFSDQVDVHLKVDPNKMKQDASSIEDKTKALFSSENGDSNLPK